MSTQPALDAFQVVADPSRRHILHLLSQDSLTINNLAGHFDMSRPAVSKHVKALHEAGFIDIRNIGRERYCVLRPDGFEELKQWIRYFDQFWTAKLNKLQQLLDEKASQ